jgi:hypothetical protein
MGKIRFPTIKISGEDFQKPTEGPMNDQELKKDSQPEGLFSETWGTSYSIANPFPKMNNHFDDGLGSPDAPA